MFEIREHIEVSLGFLTANFSLLDNLACQIFIVAFSPHCKAQNDPDVKVTAECECFEVCCGNQGARWPYKRVINAIIGLHLSHISSDKR